MFDTVIFIILAVIVILVGFKVLKSIIKALLIALIVILFVAGSLGFIIYQDISSIKDNMEKEPMLYLVLEESVFSMGFSGNNSVDKDALENYNELYADKKFSQIRGNHYKVIMIKGPLENPQEYISKLDTSEIFKEFKKGSLIVYPKTILFTIAQKAPLWLVIPVLWLL